MVPPHFKWVDFSNPINSSLFFYFNNLIVETLAMPRSTRLIIPDQRAVYHVMSRTALDGFPFQDIDKDRMVDLIRRLSTLYFTEILGFCIMGNHFHILVRMIPDSHFSDTDIKARYTRFYGSDIHFTEMHLPHYRYKWSNLSEFLKEIKQSFTRDYNKRHHRRGTLWGERFKSCIVENGETLINCLAYIDLNPIRAGIVTRPEEYRWNSLGYHIQQDNKDGFLSLDFGLTEFGVMDAAEKLRRYRRYVYEAGAVGHPGKSTAGVIDEKLLEEERMNEFNIDRVQRFRYRTRYFTDSGIIGTKAFVAENYLRFKHLFQAKHEKKPKPVIGIEGLYSLKRLSEVF
jgi:putative transposase